MKIEEVLVNENIDETFRVITNTFKTELEVKVAKDMDCFNLFVIDKGQTLEDITEYLPLNEIIKANYVKLENSNINWSKIKTGTKVKVKDENLNWVMGYFVEYLGEKEYFPFVVNITTGDEHLIRNHTDNYRYCEIVE